MWRSIGTLLTLNLFSVVAITLQSRVLIGIVADIRWVHVFIVVF